MQLGCRRVKASPFVCGVPEQVFSTGVMEGAEIRDDIAAAVALCVGAP